MIKWQNNNDYKNHSIIIDNTSKTSKDSSVYTRLRSNQNIHAHNNINEKRW